MLESSRQGEHENNLYQKGKKENHEINGISQHRMSLIGINK